MSWPTLKTTNDTWSNVQTHLIVTHVYICNSCHAPNIAVTSKFALPKFSSYTYTLGSRIFAMCCAAEKYPKSKKKVSCGK